MNRFSKDSRKLSFIKYDRLGEGGGLGQGIIVIYCGKVGISMCTRVYMYVSHLNFYFIFFYLFTCRYNFYLTIILFTCACVVVIFILF